MQEQADIIRRVAARDDIDGMLIHTNHLSRMDPYIDEVAARGKPVITFGSDAPASKRLCYIGPDAYKSGRIGGQLLSSFIGGKGNVALIADNTGHMQTTGRVQGFSDYLGERSADIRITKLDITIGNRTLYYELVRTLLSNDSFQGIFCTDANSYVIGEAMRDMGISDTVVVGFDISQMAADLMKQGYIKVILEQNPFHFAHAALKAMFSYIYLGETPDEIQHTSVSILTSECL
jgi:LacI family transcriptional regulator